MERLLLKFFKLKQWPPLLAPCVVIIIALWSPFYYSMPLFKWLIGRWTCDLCGREYGAKDEKTIHHFAYESYRNECTACIVANKLEGSE